MILFLLVYFSIYGGVHVYAFLRLKRGFELGLSANLMLALLMALMVAAPIVVRMLEHNGQGGLARSLAYISFMWMGLLFLFITSSFFFDIYQLLHFLARNLTGNVLANLTLTPRGYALVSMVLSLAILGYGFVEALNIRTETITIETDKLPAIVEKIRIAQISDVHLGLIVGKSRLGRMLASVRKARPDILVSTGDLVDGHMENPETLAGMLKNVPTRYGKFAVTGNHEFYADLEPALAFTETAGFTVLRGKGVTVKDFINIAGVDDPARGPYRPKHMVPEKELLQQLPEDKFTIFLKHQPVISKASLGLFDLQLSGHTHQGQIFPFNLMTRLAYRLPSGLTKVGNPAKVYVSRGTGTWGPPVRFLAPPEVTIIDIVATPK
jgi:predicted MPP superfamily phosphohydrolase